MCLGYTHTQESHENSLEDPKLPSLAEHEDLHKEVVMAKAQAEFKTASLNVKGLPQHAHRAPLECPGTCWFQEIKSNQTKEITVQLTA